MLKISEVVRVRCEVKQLASVAQELEPCVKRLSSQHNLDDMVNINTLIDQIANIHSPDIKYGDLLRNFEFYDIR